MTKYRGILRLKHLGFSERNIARTAGVSRNTVKRVVCAAGTANIDWTKTENMDDATIEGLLFPDRKTTEPNHAIDFEYICKELMRNGVTKKLLWIEHCESCRLCNREPLMYSQFCHYTFEPAFFERLLYTLSIADKLFAKCDALYRSSENANKNKI